ncbi:MAG: hypothetical protein L0323_09960 [Planctomycetes bacterium]|nr:hypothetical protein [Planctomycetota bacterium]
MRANWILALGAVLLPWATSPAQSTLDVPGTYATIQAAIAAAVNGDTVLVAPGTYAGPVNFLGKAITVRSSAGPFATTISGGSGGRVVRFETGEGRSSVLEGFTVTGGTSTGGSGGGGVGCSASGPTIRDCRITGNVASMNGGGFSYSDLGAGSAPPVGPLLVGCTISGNSIATPLMTLAGGGGIRCQSGLLFAGPSFVVVEFVGCTISGNMAWVFGGGALCQGVTAMFRGCTIRQNSAATPGVDLRDAFGLFQDCVVASNGAAGTGIAIAPNFSTATLQLFLTNTTVWGHAGGALSAAAGTSATISNSVLWSNGASSISGAGSIAATSSDIQGGTGQPWFGAGCIALDPMLADPAAGDFHLLFGSPCRDAGTAAAPFFSTSDFEGDPRTSGAGPDMGADEFHRHLYVTGSLTPGGAVQIKVAGPPASPVAIFFGSGALPTPTPTVFGDVFLTAPIFGFALPPIPANGLLAIPATIPASVTPPAAFYMQALVGVEVTNLSVANVN